MYVNELHKCMSDNFESFNPIRGYTSMPYDEASFQLGGSVTVSVNNVSNSWNR